MAGTKNTEAKGREEGRPLKGSQTREKQPLGAGGLSIWEEKINTLISISLNLYPSSF